jgi:hypothetical protein
MGKASTDEAIQGLGGVLEYFTFIHPIFDFIKLKLQCVRIWSKLSVKH